MCNCTNTNLIIMILIVMVLQPCIHVISIHVRGLVIPPVYLHKHNHNQNQNIYFIKYENNKIQKRFLYVYTYIYYVCTRDHWVRWSEWAILALTLTTHNLDNPRIVAPWVIIAIAAVFVRIIVVPGVIQLNIYISPTNYNIIVPVAAAIHISIILSF